MVISDHNNYYGWLPTIHVQYAQTDSNRQETLINGTIGKKSPFVKETL